MRRSPLAIFTFVLLMSAGSQAEEPPTKPSAVLEVAPTSGPAPLVVYFTADKVVDGDFYSIDFGDNDTPRKTLGFGPATHVYKKPGAYMVTLSYAENHCPPGKANPGCTQPPPMYNTISTANVVVTESNAAK